MMAGTHESIYLHFDFAFPVVSIFLVFGDSRRYIGSPQDLGGRGCATIFPGTLIYMVAEKSFDKFRGKVNRLLFSVTETAARSSASL